VRLEIDSAKPIGGWIGAGGPQRTRFDGWLQLISSLERAAGEIEAAGAKGCRDQGRQPPPRP
jgi:hypothetical protein